MDGICLLRYLTVLEDLEARELGVKSDQSNVEYRTCKASLDNTQYRLADLEKKCAQLSQDVWTT
jgi:hypothetical protein